MFYKYHRFESRLGMFVLFDKKQTSIFYFDGLKLNEWLFARDLQVRASQNEVFRPRDFSSDLRFASTLNWLIEWDDVDLAQPNEQHSTMNVPCRYRQHIIPSTSIQYFIALPPVSKGHYSTLPLVQPSTLGPTPTSYFQALLESCLDKEMTSTASPAFSFTCSSCIPWLLGYSAQEDLKGRRASCTPSVFSLLLLPSKLVSLVESVASIAWLFIICVILKYMYCILGSLGALPLL